MSCVCQRLMEFFSGGSTSNCRRKLLWTVITDVVFAYSRAQNAFCCLVGAILKILCPRERRVFQSKLGVSSSNQLNLHHSPHTGHLEKNRKRYNLIRTRCICISNYRSRLLYGICTRSYLRVTQWPGCHCILRISAVHGHTVTNSGVRRHI
jgi:hypothetical protein